MPNTCTIIITRGKNKGKLCKDVNIQCRHQQYTCSKCKQVFLYKNSYQRHAEICIASKKDTGATHSVKKEARRNITNDACKEIDSTNDNVTPYIDSTGDNVTINLLLEEMKELKQLMAEMSNKPTIVNNIERQVNIQVVIHDYYGALRDKLGSDRARSMLANIAKDGQPMAILDNLYFDGKKPIEYPIASRNDQVRYLTDEGQIQEENLDDFANKLSDKLTTAMLQATNEMIKETVATGEVDSLYDVYDIGSVQHNIAVLNRDKGQFKADLRNYIEVPNHPYFD